MDSKFGLRLLCLVFATAGCCVVILLQTSVDVVADSSADDHASVPAAAEREATKENTSTADDPDAAVEEGPSVGILVWH